MSEDLGPDRGHSLARHRVVRALSAAAVLGLALTGCGGDEPISNVQAQILCARWVKKAAPGYSVSLREPVVAEKDRMVTVRGSAVKGRDRQSVMCAVDIVKARVIAGFTP